MYMYDRSGGQPMSAMHIHVVLLSFINVQHDNAPSIYIYDADISLTMPLIGQYFKNTTFLNQAVFGNSLQH